MIFSKTTSYAIRILIFMSVDNEEGFSSKYLYDKLKIPQRYLRRLLTDLSKSGFITSNRGRNGGFTFSKKIDTIFLSDIIDAVEGLESINACPLGIYDCKMINTCAMHDIWTDVKDKMLDTLSKTSLQDIKERTVLKM